ncbi:MAG: alkylmercury lyase [Propionibacteriales bacterium]|nr:alkylmercury lyase [Propionibacteriales bacterium]
MEPLNPTRIDLWYDHDCPNAPLVRQRLLACLRRAGGAWDLREHRDRGVMSPTLTVDGADVTDATISAGSGCRLDLPSQEQICTALERHQGETP